MALANYSTLNNFQREYERINGSNPEDCVGATWSVILGTIFPAMQGDYAIESQARNPGAYTDFTICDWVGPLRRPGWQTAERQLRRYLQGWAQTARQGQTARETCYGAIAIGKRVRFYTYNYETNDIAPMQRRVRRYEVNNDAQIIAERLWYIRNNHN